METHEKIRLIRELNKWSQEEMAEKLAMSAGGYAKIERGETQLNILLTQDKAGRLDYSESLMTHAMVLTGVDLDENGKAKKWKVENSWGEKVGNKGYFVASDAWMDEYTYQIVVRKEFLTAAELAAYEAEPLVLAPWDPMGSLA